MTGRGRARVRFDDQALDEDLRRLNPAGRQAIASTRDALVKDGAQVDRLRACQADHPSGASLPGCLKLYVPDDAGRWRIIMRIGTDDDGPLLVYLAAGIGHHRRGARAPTAYEIAHHRLHGAWPRRGRR